MNAWDRQLNESQPCWEAFQIYRDLGMARSVAEVARRLGKVKRAIETMSSKYSWRVRVAAYDEHLDRLRQDAAAKTEEAIAAEWAERRNQHRQAMWDLTLRARKRLEAMLEWPLSTQEIEDDGKRIVITPAKWTWSTVARLLAEVDKVGRLATELETERPRITISREEAEELGRPFGKSGEQVQREIEDILKRMGL